MPLNVTLNQILTQALAVAVLLKVGLIVTASGHILYSLTQRVCGVLGHEPIDPAAFQQPFDQLYDFLSTPLGEKIGALDRSTRTTEVLLHTAIGVVVISGVVLLEITSMIAVAGIALAGTYFTGITFELVPVYRAIVALLVLFTLSFMTYSNWRIQQESAYV